MNGRRLKRDHGGASPSALEQVLPEATTDAALAIAEQHAVPAHDDAMAELQRANLDGREDVRV